MAIDSFVYETSTTSTADVERWIAESKPTSLAAARSGFPWIWCRDARPGPPTTSTPKFDASAQGFDQALDQLTRPFTDACQAIEDDASIKIHGNNSKAKQRHALTVQWLKSARRLAQKHGITSGNDLEVDNVWAQICRNMILPNGHLHGLSRTAKVCSSSERTYTDKDGREGSAWIVIVYADDSWDEDLVRSVLAGTLKSVGRKTTGFKTDVTTMAGIYAPKTTTDPITKKRVTTPGHPSKMRTTLYAPTDILEQSEIDALIAQGKAEQPASSKSSSSKPFGGSGNMLGGGNTLGGGSASSPARAPTASSSRSPASGPKLMGGFGSLGGRAGDASDDDDDGGDPGAESPIGKTVEKEKEGHAWPETGGAAVGGSSSAPLDHHARRALAAAAAARREAEAPKVEKPPPSPPKPVVKPVVKRPILTNSRETAIELYDSDDDVPPAKRTRA